MSFTYTLSSDIGRVRLLVPDTNSVSPLFTDEEILAFLEIENQNPFHAAALAIETVASRELSTVPSDITLSDGTSIKNPSSAGKALLERAAQLRVRAMEIESYSDYGSFGVAEVNSIPFAAHRILIRR